MLNARKIPEFVIFISRSFLKFFYEYNISMGGDIGKINTILSMAAGRILFIILNQVTGPTLIMPVVGHAGPWQIFFF